MNSSASSASTLIQKLKSRDEAAWQRLVDLYQPLLLAWCRHYGVEANHAADVVQEVFSQVARSIGDFEPHPGGSFRGWLWRITRNKLNDWHRKEQDRILAAGGTDAQKRMAEVPEELPENSDVVLRREADSLMLRGIELVRSEFEDRTWKAFWRSVVEGEPTADIARDMKITTNAVRQAKSRVLRRLRAELGDTPV